ncbi:MAG: glucosamine-6-phosphate deaminase [Rikenellaceae bacterium]|nr:glucosamine-6-phosphate deaminase [Rikenellaceae bacterium]
MKSNYKLHKEGGLVKGAEPRDIVCRYEKINTMLLSTESDAADYVSDKIIAAINAKPVSEGKFVLGLTTGKSPVGIYRQLVAKYNEGKVSFKNVVVFALDELYPIAPSHLQSRHSLLKSSLLDQVDIATENIYIPNGSVSVDKVHEECAAYEAKIKACGGIDLLLLGTGAQGQIGFNQAGSFNNTKTRMVVLNNNSLSSISEGFRSDEEVPSKAITMGIDTIMNAKSIIMTAWGEEKSAIVREVVEGEVTGDRPATYLQEHDNIELVVDETAAQELTRVKTPWLVGTCDWQPKFIRKAVAWLCGKVGKPILKLTYKDYIDNSLGQLLDVAGTYDSINIKVFNDLQHTITGWPGGKPNADDSTRPERALPYPKRVVVFSPHPDDDVISMGGTLCRLAEQGHDVHIAYETSGNFAVHDDVVMQILDTARECGLENRYDEVKEMIKNKKAGEPDPRELLSLKGAIRRGEAKAAVGHFGVPMSNAHFLNLPFYETGGLKKGELSQADIDIIVALLQEIKPHQIYAAGDLADPHGTHRVCIEAVLGALEQLKDEAWVKDCNLWLYRGAWQEWELDMVDMAVPLSPDEVIKKRHAIYKHLSQKDIVPFPGEDAREFWQRAEERNQNTARMYDQLGMAEYQAIEVFVKLDLFK